MHNEELNMASKAEEVARTLERDKRGKWWRYLLGAIVLLGVAAAIGWFMYPTEETISYVTQPVERGNMTLTATATGDLQPKRTVAIGAEISGMINSVEVEANDRVEAGQPCRNRAPATSANLRIEGLPSRYASLPDSPYFP